MNKDIIHLAHANGFPGDSYRVITDQLQARYSVYWNDCLAHQERFPVTNNWPHLAQELIEYYETHYSQPIIAIGHSLGGVLSLMAAQQRPDLLKAVILLDSPMLTFWQSNALRYAKLTGLTRTFLPIDRIANRQQQWRDEEEAIRYFSSKPLMKYFDQRCLRDYVAAATETDKESSTAGLRLRFRPDIEANIWSTIPDNINTYKKLPIPSAVIAGRRSRVFTQANAAVMKRMGMTVEWLDGGHLFPFEQPEETSELILRLLDNVPVVTPN